MVSPHRLIFEGPGGCPTAPYDAILVVVPRPSEGHLTEPTAAAQARWPEPVFMPLRRPSMDIYGLEGNIAVARVLFARNGTHD